MGRFIIIKTITLREYKFNKDKIQSVIKYQTAYGKWGIQIRMDSGNSHYFVEGVDIDNVENEFDKFQ